MFLLKDLTGRGSAKRFLILLGSGSSVSFFKVVLPDFFGFYLHLHTRSHHYVSLLCLQFLLSLSYNHCCCFVLLMLLLCFFLSNTKHSNVCFNQLKYQIDGERERERKKTWRSWMRLSRDLIFLWGHRRIPNSLHFFFKTVRPTLRFREASTIVTPKYLERSSKESPAICSDGVLFFFNISVLASVL